MEAVETHRVDTEQATGTKAAFFRLFTDITSGVPDWTAYCAAVPLLPSRASQMHDYENLTLRQDQARSLHLLTTINGIVSLQQRDAVYQPRNKCLGESLTS